MAKSRTKFEDAKLVSLARGGDVRAFEHLVECHLPMVHAIAYARMGNAKTAEDLTQEAFLRAHLYLDSLNDAARFAAWLARITRNLAVSWQRSGQADSHLVSKVPLDELANKKVKGAGQIMEAGEQASAVHGAIFNLPTEQREMVMLHYFEGFNKNEIAERLEVHPATVGRQLKKALAVMKHSLEPILRDAAPVFRASSRLRVRTIALIGAVSILSVQTKTALAVAAGGKAWAASVSLAGSKTISAGGGLLGLAKTVSPTLVTGVKIMGIGKGVVIVCTAGALTVGGAFYVNKKVSNTDTGKAVVKQVSVSTDSNLSASEKQLLKVKEECFPEEVYNHLEKSHEQAGAKFDKADELMTLTLAQVIDKDKNVWLGGFLSANNDEETKTGEISMGNVGYAGSMCVFNKRGTLLKNRLVEKDDGSGNRDWYITLEEPLETGQKLEIFGLVGMGKLQSVGAGRYKLTLQNYPGAEGIQRHVLVLPAGYRLTWQTQEPYSVKKVGDFKIHTWQKRVSPGENHKIDVALDYEG
ncbi:MAG: RNA polymerase sigma factor [Planctomycetes bacterium]|nr:RNA polymerase sigma factor [Planctomycetota bacterium]